MLKTASQGQRTEGKKAKFDVEIASVATAVPDRLTASPQAVLECALVPAVSLTGSEVAHNHEAVLAALMKKKVEEWVG